MQSSSAQIPVPGERIDRYRVLARIAEGGMAAVYAVRRDHATFDKLLAMKVLLPHLRSETRFVQMLLDEARIASNVTHPNVVQVFDVGEHGGSPFIVMEYLRGVSLSAALERSATTLRRPALYGALADVAEGLHAAHRATGTDGEKLAIVHRDVSPQNVMLCFDGQVKVVDFGIAAARGRLTSTETGELKGKISYVAPEQLHRRHPVDAATDLWALGVMAWQALARRPLFKGETASDTMWNILNREVPDLLEIDPDVPTEVVDLIESCLSRESFSRPASAARCAEVLRAASGLSERELREALAEDLQVAFEEECLSELERTESLVRMSTAQSDALLNDTVLNDTVLSDTVLNGTTQSGTAPTLPPTAPRRTFRIVASLAAVGLVVAGAIAAITLTGPGGIEAPPADDEITFDNDMTGNDSAEGSPAHSEEQVAVEEPVPRFVELAVPEAAILVLVDGQRHDERPLRVPLFDGQSAEVVAVSEAGETRIVVDEETEAGALDVASARRPTKREQRRQLRGHSPRAPSMETAPDEQGLLEVPL